MRERAQIFHGSTLTRLLTSTAKSAHFDFTRSDRHNLCRSLHLARKKKRRPTLLVRSVLVEIWPEPSDGAAVLFHPSIPWVTLQYTPTPRLHTYDGTTSTSNTSSTGAPSPSSLFSVPSTLYLGTSTPDSVGDSRRRKEEMRWTQRDWKATKCKDCSQFTEKLVIDGLTRSSCWE